MDFKENILLVGLYEDKLFPSASLAIALNHYNVSFDSVEIFPGMYIRFDLPEKDEHGRNFYFYTH